MNTSRSRFLIALMQELMVSMNNWYGSENWDHERFGPYKSSFKREALSKLNELFSGRIAIVPSNINRGLVQNLSSMENYLEGFASLYELLADESSKSTLVSVLAYRIMGDKHVKLPVNTSWYWSTREGMRSLIKSSEAIKVKYPDLLLNHYSLESIGYPIELFFAPSGVMVTFILKQYEYGKRTPAIKVKEGDYVIDGGGCWGDTALYFAHTIGEHGKVFTFEFTPENLDIFQRNMDFNPQPSQRIELVPRALWETSGETISYSPCGPGTTMTQGPQESNNHDSLKITTVSIDDFVKERNLPRVDFIKMDIEGAELRALKGAEKTIRAYQPRLAIAVYHRQADFSDISTYLNDLDVGYEFFLDHFTIYGEETVLFATPKID
jgi:FkbM family methyltransferase